MLHLHYQVINATAPGNHCSRDAKVSLVPGTLPSSVVACQFSVASSRRYGCSLAQNSRWKLLHPLRNLHAEAFEQPEDSTPAASVLTSRQI